MQIQVNNYHETGSVPEIDTFHALSRHSPSSKHSKMASRCAIPAHRRTQRLKRALRLKNDVAPDNSVPEYWDRNILWLPHDNLEKNPYYRSLAFRSPSDIRVFPFLPIIARIELLSLERELLLLN